MARVYLGLGSNLDAEENLRMAVRELRRRYDVIALSPVYRAGAVGFSGPDFLNLVAVLESDAPPESINEVIEEIHDLAGRQRSSRRFASRVLDIDLLMIDQLRYRQGRVRLPREDVLQYGFVLRPLVDVAPDLEHPETGRTLAEHWREFVDDGHPLTITNVIL